MRKMAFWVGAIEILAFILLITMIVFFLISYSTLPERIPHGTAPDGEVFYGGKERFLICFWLGVGAYGLLFLLKRFPRLMSYPVKITPENVDFQAKLGRLMLSITTLLFMAIFTLVIYDLYQSAAYMQAGNIVLIAVLFGAVLLNGGIYWTIARKHK